MRAPVLVSVVIAIHVMAASAIVFIQGCGTTHKGTATVEPPSAPIMPSSAEVEKTPEFKPMVHPPVAVEPASAVTMPTEGKTYVIQNGDSLSKIASRMGVSTRELAEVNGIKDLNKIRIGQKLMLPDYAGAPQPAAAASKSKGKEKKAGKAKSEVTDKNAYVVQPGDALSKIAAKHGIKVNELREANNLKGDKILVGQKLVIPGAKMAEKAAEMNAPAVEAPAAPAPETAPPAPAPAAEPAPAPAPAAEPAPAPAASDASTPPSPVLSTSQDNPMDYIVQANDTLDSIAKLFIVRKEDIMKLNKITDPNASLQSGQKIKIPPTAL